MELVRELAEKQIDILLKNCRVKRLKNKLSIKKNNCSPKNSIRKTFVKLFNLLTCKIKTVQNSFLSVYPGFPVDVTLFFVDNKSQFIFKNVLRINETKVNNFNKDVNINFFFNNYINNNNKSNDIIVNRLLKKSLSSKSKKWIKKTMNSVLYSTRFTPGGAGTITSSSATNYFASNSGSYNSSYTFNSISVSDSTNVFLFSMCGAGGNGNPSAGGSFSSGGGAGGYGQFFVRYTFTYFGIIYTVTYIKFGIDSSSGENITTVEIEYTSVNGVYKVTYTVGNGENSTSDDTYATGGSGLIISPSQELSDIMPSYVYTYGEIIIQGATAAFDSQSSNDNTSGDNGYYGVAGYYTVSGASINSGGNTGNYSTQTGLTLPGGETLSSVGGGFNSTEKTTTPASGFGSGGLAGSASGGANDGTPGCCEMQILPAFTRIYNIFYI